VRIESRSSPGKGMILIRYELAKGMNRYLTKTGTGILEHA